MRHNIFSYSQEVAVKLGLTLPDLLILQWMADFFPTSKVVKHKVGNKIYFWVNYEKLLKDLPILNVSKDRLYRWLKSLTDSHVLEHYTLRNQDGTFSLYRFGDNYEALLGYGDIEENVAPVESEEKPKAEKTTKKRSYSEVFEAEENVYIKEALSKWLKVCKDRGVKFNIVTSYKEDSATTGKFPVPQKKKKGIRADVRSQEGAPCRQHRPDAFGGGRSEGKIGPPRHAARLCGLRHDPLVQVHAP